MLSLTRYRVPAAEADDFSDALRSALDILSTRPGFVRGRIARAADDADLWLLFTEWEGAGTYRRALSSYEVKVGAVPAMSRAIDEPGAFEVFDAKDLPAAR